MWGTVLATICAAPKLSKSLCEQQHAMHTTMKAKAIAEVLLPIRNCKDWEGPLQNCRLHSCPEIILQINQKRFLFLSSTKQLLQKGGLHHIPSCFNNLVCVKLLSTPTFPASPHSHFLFLSKSIEKARNVHVNAHDVLQSVLHTASTYVRGREII